MLDIEHMFDLNVNHDGTERHEMPGRSRRSGTAKRWRTLGWRTSQVHGAESADGRPTINDARQPVVHANHR